MLFINLFNNNFGVLVTIFCILGVLPIVTIGINLYKTKYRPISFALFGFSLSAVGFSATGYINKGYLAAIIITVVAVNIIVTSTYKCTLRHNKITDNEVDPGNDE